jgi:hypothetical protein
VPFRGREKVLAGPLRGRLQMQLEVLRGQWLGARLQRDLAREGEARQMQQVLVLDKDAMQRCLGTRGKPRGSLDCCLALGGSVERDDDALDRADHGRDPRMDPARANSTAFAANASSRLATR